MEDMKLSVILPAYREPFLNKTISSLLTNSFGEVEILVVLDGYIPSEPVNRSDSRVKVISLDKNKGMRGAINAGLSEAKGDFVMKLDAHCAVEKGYDKILTEGFVENWLVIPRRYSLDIDNWTRQGSTVNDYHYFVFPGAIPSHYGYAFTVANWKRKGRENVEIDDVMTFQGSCWVANRKYFMERVGFLDDNPETYGGWCQDQAEIGLKYWLGGGEVRVNKKVWYAHLSKRGYHYKQGLFSRWYKRNSRTVYNNEWGTKHWMNNQESGMIHSFSWLVEKFWPVPSWPDDWEKTWKEHNGQ